MFGGLLDLFEGLWWSSDPEVQLAKDTRRRAARAYRTAWSARPFGGRLDDEPLVRELRALNVPGSFTDPWADSLLRPYVEAWRAGVDPRALSATVDPRGGR